MAWGAYDGGVSTVVEIPRQAVTRFDLPEVCLVTGATEGVRYRETSFVFVPIWARLSVAFCGLIGLVVMAVSTKRARAELPFTDEAWQAWVRAKRIVGVLFFCAFAVLAVPLLDLSPLLPGLVGFVAVLIAAVIYSMTALKGAGPMCKYIDDRIVTLEIPSEDAAVAIEKRLGLGEHAALAGEATPAEPSDELDRKLQAELDAMP